MVFATNRARPAHLPAVHRRRADRADQVFARDCGVCAICRTHCVEVRTTAITLRDEHGPEAARGFLAGLGFRLKSGRPIPSRLWEVDHVVPVAEGGSDDLENLSTLCLRCHAEKTAAQRPRNQRRPRPVAPVSIERATVDADGALRFSLPIATPSLNETLRHHRNIGARGKAAAALRQLVQAVIAVEFRTRRRAARIEILRVGARLLDPDNLRGGVKPFVDALRYSGTIADDDASVEQDVRQERGDPPRTDVAIWFREELT